MPEQKGVYIVFLQYTHYELQIYDQILNPRISVEWRTAASMSFWDGAACVPITWVVQHLSFFAKIGVSKLTTGNKTEKPSICCSLSSCLAIRYLYMH